MPKLFMRARLGVIFRISFTICVLGLSARGVAQRMQGGARGESANQTEVLDFQMAEAAEARGLQFTHKVSEIPNWLQIKPWLESLGVGVSVADVNEDGFMDVLLSNSQIGTPNALYINDGKGHFENRTGEFGLDKTNEGVVSGRSIFFDCNGDGHRDLIQVTNQCPHLYVKSGNGPFVSKTISWPHSACNFAQAVTVADINDDEQMDLIFGGYPTDLTGLRMLPSSVVNGNNGAEITVMLGNGQCHFEKAENILNADGRFFYLSIGVGDLRNQGKKDFWFATDFATDKVFLERSNSYEKQPPLNTKSFSGMNSEVVYLDADAPPFVFVSQAYKEGYSIGGNNFWQFNGTKFVDESIPRGLHQCGWSWGGRAIDMNNDGLIDLALANGFISGNPEQDYWYPFSTVIGSATAVMADVRFWPDMRGKSLSGHQQDCLYLNKGDSFVNVATQLGFDRQKLDGRAVAVIDSDNSGHQHLLVGNQKGRLYYYEFTPPAANAWVGFQLEGSPPNTEAIGAKITISVDGKRFARENYTTNTFASQSDPRIHFGLGQLKKMDWVEVRWSNGKTQRFEGFEINRYHKLSEKRSL